MINLIKNLFSSTRYIVSKSDKNDQFYFALKAKNGETILQSEGYLTEQGALDGIKSVSENGNDVTKYEITQSKDNRFYFTLKAVNHKVIGTSETYVSDQGAREGVLSVMENCQTTKIHFKYK